MEKQTTVPVQEECVLFRARKGDSRAWEELFSSFAARLLIYIIHRMGPLASTYTGEDIVQEVFLAAFKSITKTRFTTDSFYAWLRGIADNRMRDLRRRLGAKKRHGSRAVVSADLQDSYWQGAARGTLAKPWRRSPTKPSVRAVRREEFQRALEILQSLKPSAARVFFLRWYEGLSVDEIASRLSITQNAVYKRRGRACAAIASFAGESSGG